MNNRLTGRVELESLTPRKSKECIDPIDVALGKPYGLNQLQLDEIVNYDIKYRIGPEGERDDD